MGTTILTVHACHCFLIFTLPLVLQRIEKKYFINSSSHKHSRTKKQTTDKSQAENDEEMRSQERDREIWEVNS